MQEKNRYVRSTPGDGYFADVEAQGARRKTSLWRLWLCT